MIKPKYLANIRKLGINIILITKKIYAYFSMAIIE